MINLPETHRPYRSHAGPKIDPEHVTSLPPFVADHPLAREDWAAYLQAVQLVDEKVGKILALLEEDGLAEQTVVAFFSDHGREDFRSKSSAFDGGTRVPLIVRWPGQIEPGIETDELVSLIDVTASSLALAGLTPPAIQGVDFLDATAPPRDFVFTARDRIEESVDRVRTVFDGRFRYIRNFLPDQPHLIDRAYYDRTNPVRGLIRELYAAGELTPQQARVFAPQRPAEELYDLSQDPHEMENLVASSTPSVQAALARLRTALDIWIIETGDQGGEPENPEARDIGGGPGGRKRGGARPQEGAQDGSGAGSAGSQAATPSPAASPLVLAQVGVRFAGGRNVPVDAAAAEPMSTNTIGQAPVHFLVPQDLRHAAPVVMLPGMGLTSYLYLSTPDGREGWAQRFPRAGFAVYIMDQPSYAISGFDVRPFTAVRAGAAAPDSLPGIKLWANEATWRDWGFGPEYGIPFDDAQYPLDQVEQLYASFSPVISPSTEGRGAAGGTRGTASQGRGRRLAGKSSGLDGGDRFGASRGASALLALLEEIGPATLVLHSAAGATGIAALQTRPELINALVMIEPVGAPTDEELVESLLADKAYLAVFGDHFDTRHMQGRFDACLETARLVAAAGGRAKMLHLPAQGVRGNSHLLMQDTNSHAIAEQITAWLAEEA